MTIDTKLQTVSTTKAAIKTSIEAKGPDLTGVPFTDYHLSLDSLSASDYIIGDIIDFRINQSAEGWLPCDGSLINNAGYPELVAFLNASNFFGVGTPPAGYTYLPDLDPVTHGDITTRPVIKGA